MQKLHVPSFSPKSVDPQPLQPMAVRRRLTTDKMLCRVLLLPLTIILTVVLPLVQQIITTVCGWVSSVITVIQTVVQKVCDWLPWPLDAICNWVSKTISVLQTVWNWVCNTVTTIVITLITKLIDLVIYVLRIVCIIISVVLGLPGLLLCLLGLRIPYTVRVCIKVITDDMGRSLVTDEAIAASMAAMRDVYAQCGFTVEFDGIERIAQPSLLTSTNDSFWGIFSSWHSWFSQHACSCCGQVTVFFVDQIQGNSDGLTYWGDNWCRVDDRANGDPTIMGHEVGHLLNLWHVDDNNDLMFASSGPPANPRNMLTGFQCCWIRSSPFALVGSRRK